MPFSSLHCLVIFLQNSPKSFLIIRFLGLSFDSLFVGASKQERHQFVIVSIIWDISEHPSLFHWLPTFSNCIFLIQAYGKNCSEAYGYIALFRNGEIERVPSLKQRGQVSTLMEIPWQYLGLQQTLKFCPPNAFSPSPRPFNLWSHTNISTVIDKECPYCPCLGAVIIAEQITGFLLRQYLTYSLRCTGAD